jgi:LmbE family N-acetylglucosaminyl deacetylase
MQKILVIAPHPDDEVLGCGGTIAKYANNGDEVHLCIATKAYVPDWSEETIINDAKEIADSTKILGVKETYVLNFPVVKLDTIPQKDINHAISKIIKEIDPDVVFVPFKGDLNNDHKIIFESCLVALRPMDNRNRKILVYETLSETEWGYAEQFVPNFYVDISETLNKKIDAMKAYAKEIKEYPHPRSIEIIEALAKKRGSEVCLKYAEAFCLIREVER